MSERQVGFAIDRAPRFKAPERKTRLDLLLDEVQAGQRELTIDTEDYSSADVDRVIKTAQKRGLSASYDGRFVLVRDLRRIHEAPHRSSRRYTVYSSLPSGGFTLADFPSFDAANDHAIRFRLHPESGEPTTNIIAQRQHVSAAYVLFEGRRARPLQPGSDELSEVLETIEDVNGHHLSTAAWERGDSIYGDAD